MIYVSAKSFLQLSEIRIKRIMITDEMILIILFIFECNYLLNLMAKSEIRRNNKEIRIINSFTSVNFES